MDFSKIISDSTYKSVTRIANGKFDNELKFDDPKLQETIQQNRFLMNYSAILLETYHEELRKELAAQGIQI